MCAEEPKIFHILFWKWKEACSIRIVRMWVGFLSKMAEGLCLSFRAKLVGCVVMMQQTTGVTDARPRRGGWGDLRGGGDAGLAMTTELQRSRSTSLELILSPLIQSTYQWVSDPHYLLACLLAHLPACVRLPLLCISPLLTGIQEHRFEDGCLLGCCVM